MGADGRLTEFNYLCSAVRTAAQGALEDGGSYPDVVKAVEKVLSTPKEKPIPLEELSTETLMEDVEGIKAELEAEESQYLKVKLMGLLEITIEELEKRINHPRFL